MTKTNPIDYSKKESWYQIPEITKEVDTFYVYATEYIMGSLAEGAPDYATIDNAEMLEGAAGEYLLHATAYADSTNVFVPYYRQAGLRYAGVVWKRDGIFDAAIADMPYGDIVAALDYYFEHYNNGRPFIIASHSQGSAIVKMVLKYYFAEHPDYYKRMVAGRVQGLPAHEVCHWRVRHRRHRHLEHRRSQEQGSECPYRRAATWCH